MPFLVLCTSCEYAPSGTADNGTVTRELVKQRMIATREQAETFRARPPSTTPTAGNGDHLKRRPDMTTDGIEALFLETHNLGKAAKFFQVPAKNWPQGVRTLWLTS
jgi:hypothetical protein